MRYTKNNEKIEYIIFTVCFISLFAFLLLIRDKLKEVIPNEIALTTVLCFLSLAINKYVIFNLISRHFFKLPYVKHGIVNFNGKWDGKGKSTNGDTEYKVSIDIQQTLTDISINAKFRDSVSEALSCSVLKENNKEKLIYNYLNRPDNTKVDLDKHYGTIFLEKIGKSKLEGNYFTDRKLQTKGKLELKLKSK